MPSHRKRLLILAAPIAASLAFAGPAAAADSNSDKAILKAGVITKADVPPEWVAAGRAASTSSLNGMKECRKINTAVAKARKDEPRARSREFSDVAGPQARTQAENTVYAFPDKKAASKFLSVFNSRAATACFQALGAQVAQNRPTAGEPTVAPITDLQGVGNEAFGSEIAVTYAQGDGTATLYIDFVFVRVGRSALGFIFANVDARIPQGPDIVNAVVQRVTAAEK
jgi:hypothetical protein